jgi:hypothetical protein
VLWEYFREKEALPRMREEIQKTLIGCEECKKYNILTTRVGQRINPK